MNRNDIDMFVPEVGQRIYVTGQSGSGKTYFVTRIVKRSVEMERHTIIFDVKAEFDYSIFPVESYIATTPNSVVNAGKQGVQVIIYQPSERFLRDQDGYNTILEYAYARTNTQIVIDEIYSLSHKESRTRFPDALFTIITRGRSKGITCYFCSQRPAWHPKECISESRKIVAFPLQLPNDRKLLADCTGEPIFLQSVDKLVLLSDSNPTGYEFLYYDQGAKQPGIYVLDN